MNVSFRVFVWLVVCLPVSIWVVVLMWPYALGLTPGLPFAVAGVMLLVAGIRNVRTRREFDREVRKLLEEGS